MSNLNRQDAQKQAKRLQSCPMLAPQTDEGRKEIVDCLIRNCQNADHAAAVMTQVLDNALKVEGPITAWIAATARNTQVASEAPAGCDECSLGPDPGTGEMRWSNHVSGTRAGYSIALRCSCARGRWLTARDEARAKGADAERKPATRHEHPADADWQKRAAGER